DIRFPGRTQQASIRANAITPGYFETMRTPVVLGRDFTVRDDAASPQVAIVSEAFVRRYFPDGRAIGEHFSTGTDDVEIIGVVKDSAGDSLRQAMRSQVYFPYMQRGGAPFPVTMEVRAESSLIALAQTLRVQLQPKLGLPPEVRTMTSEVDKTLVQERMMATV